MTLTDQQYAAYVANLDSTTSRPAMPAPTQFDPKAYGAKVAKASYASTPEGQAPAVHARGLVEYGWGKDFYTPKDEVKGEAQWAPPPSYLTPNVSNMPAAPEAPGTVRGVPYDQYKAGTPKELAPVIITPPQKYAEHMWSFQLQPQPEQAAITVGSSLPSMKQGDVVVAPEQDWTIDYSGKDASKGSPFAEEIAKQQKVVAKKK